MSDKVYLDAQDLLDDAFRLGAAVVESGFRPSFILALWRGGAPIGIAVQEYLAYHGIETDHIAIRTAHYAAAIDESADRVEIYGISYLLKNMTHEDRLLIVDDVFDTGRTVDAVIKHLQAKARRNTPADVRIAVPYYKPTRNKTERVPDYALHETTAWIKFPHSLEGLSHNEIRQHRPELAVILATAKTES
ncbi:MAG: phosphoribosyltransferase family protein [Pseudomonadota bacterium]